MEKLLYIGVGTHIEPVNQFNEVKEFVFIDTLPRSPHDGFGCPNGTLFYDGFYRSRFITQLLEELNKYNFNLIENISLDLEYHNKILTTEQKNFWRNNFLQKFPYINPHLLLFKNNITNQILKYYISTNILTNMCDRLSQDIFESSGIIICGYHPDKIILDYISKPIKLYCYTGTCYYLGDDEVDYFNNLIFWLFKNLDKVDLYFNNIYVCHKDNKNIIKCENLINMNYIVQKFK